MRLFYLIAAHNEADTLPQLFEQLSSIPERFPGSRICIVENGSDDGSQEVLRRLAKTHPWSDVYFEDGRGMGIAFQRGLKELAQYDLTADDWILFNAADLPFGFSDLESFLSLRDQHTDVLLFIGSKSHVHSKIKRSIKRSVASRVFQILRFLFLNMRTKDPQGTLFLRGDALSRIQQNRSEDYFYTTELVYVMEKVTRVVEMPVALRDDKRPSKVHLIRDGLRVTKQILKLSFSRKG